jgi:hypothetical protein
MRLAASHLLALRVTVITTAEIPRQNLSKSDIAAPMRDMAEAMDKTGGQRGKASQLTRTVDRCLPACCIAPASVRRSCS